MILLFGRTSFGQEASVKTAQSQEIWRDEAWIRLGHYQKHLFGWRSPFTGPFFIDPKGARNPEAELLATVRAFVAPTPEEIARYQMPPACFFKARYRWLQTRLNLSNPPACPEREAWKARFHGDSLSLIFAASDLNSATSSFGHTFLKFSNSENRGGKELLDYGLNYAADANKNEGVFYALKGLFGFYPGHFSLLPFHQKLREYTNVEGRDLWEYPLRLTPAQVDLLIDHLLELEGASAPYYFMSDNCSYELLRALEVADPAISISKHLPFFVIPIDTVKRLVRDTDVTEPGKFRQSLKSDYLAHYRLLARADRQALRETIDHLQTPEEQNLTKEQKALLLETAMKYFALEAFESNRDLDNEEYKLSVQRARLGGAGVFDALPPPVSPDQSHDSSALYLGRGSREARDFTSLKFRFAFHDLEENEVGAVKFSRSNILAFETRFYENPGRFSLERMTWIDVLNTVPLNVLEQNLSWKARFETIDPWKNEIAAGVGYSFDFVSREMFSARLTTLAAVEYHQTQLRAGPNAFLMARMFDRLGLSLESGLYYGTDPKPDIPVHFNADLQLSRNWELRFESRGPFETQVRLVNTFLL